MAKTKEYNKRYFDLLYKSKNRIARRVLRMEHKVANTLKSLIDNSYSLNDQKLASDMEWLLTWRLKRVNRSEFFWCDGVQFDEINQVNKRYIEFQGTAWIGPESNDELYEVPILGNMSVSPSGKKLKKYIFKISYNESPIIVGKNLTKRSK